MTNVHLGWSPSPEAVEMLRAALLPGVVLSIGENAAPDYEVLVSGRPSRTDLEASRRLRVVVIPWAGVPAGTGPLLREFPHLALHNLHHNAIPTAETALTLLLAAAKRVVPADGRMREGDWADRGASHPALLLAGRTAVILGFGAIGRRLAALCEGIGMKVVPWRRGEPLDDVLPRAEALLVCLPLTDETRGLLGARELGLLPRGAVLVNVGRGPLVDEDALYEALADGRLHGAGLDVWYRYPRGEEGPTMPAGRPFHELPSVVMSPHRAGSCDRTESLRMEHLARLLNAIARGEEPPNRVDLDRGY